MLPLVMAGVDDLDALISAQLEGMDALILTGGHDIDPGNYAQSRREGCGSSLPGRDAFDLALLAEALRRQLPILGICRGFQIINIALSGTLHQDLATERPSDIQHWQSSASDQTSHSVAVKPNTRLAEALSAEAIEVTSFHHQGIDALGQGLVVSATAPDGLIEAFELPTTEPWLVAVQWHPEMSHRIDVAGRRIFTALIEAAKAAKAH